MKNTNKDAMINRLWKYVNEYMNQMSAFFFLTAQNSCSPYELHEGQAQEGEKHYG